MVTRKNISDVLNKNRGKNRQVYSLVTNWETQTDHFVCLFV